MLFSTALLLTSSKMWSFSMWSTSRSVISPVMEVIGRGEDFLRKCCQSHWLKLCLNTNKLFDDIFELGIFNLRTSITFYSRKFSGSKERHIIALRQPWTQFPCIALCLVLRKVDLSKFAVEKLPIYNSANADSFTCA